LPAFSHAASATVHTVSDRSPTRLVVLFGGASAEHDVSCVSGRHVLVAARSNYTLDPVGITRTGQWVKVTETARQLAAGEELPDSLEVVGEPIDPLAYLDPDCVVFPVLHGPMGEDGSLQGLLEMAAVPYVGSGVLGSALCMDKLIAKEVLDAKSIPQCRHLAVNSSEWSAATAADLVDELGTPLFVKPANMGSSIGVSRATDVGEIDAALKLAFSYDEWVVVEEAVAGREIECSVLGNRTPRVSVAGEIVPGADFYSYEDKYENGADLRIPADLPAAQLAELQDIAATAYLALRAEGLARADFFLEDPGRGFLLNELNTMPGFTPISMYPKLWDASGLPYDQLIDELVGLARERFERRGRHTRTDH
jgi:D-alanine-D-alanine ligase